MSNLVLISFVIFVFISLALMYFYGSKSHLLKFLVIAPIASMMVLIGMSLESYKGWPSEEIFEEGRIVAVQIVNPSVSTDGHIYIWGYRQEDGEPIKKPWWEDILYYTYQAEIPRVMEIPYTKEKARAMAKAKKGLMEGDYVSLKKKKKGKNTGKMKKERGYQSLDADEFQVEIHPPKEAMEKPDADAPTTE